MGWARFEDGKAMGCGTAHFDTKIQALDRMLEIHGVVDYCIESFDPGLVVIESHESWTQNGKNVGALQLLGISVGVIMACGFSHKLRVKTVTPGEWNPQHWSAGRVSAVMKGKYGLNGSQDAMAAMMIAEYACARLKFWEAEWWNGVELVQAVQKRKKGSRSKGGRSKGGKVNDDHARILGLIKKAEGR